MPQATQAPAISSAPQPTPAGPPCQDSSTAPARMASAPSRMRRSTFSRNTTQAIAMVARPSRLSSSAASAADVRARPNISSTGPTTPPASTTSASHGRSARRSGASAAPMPSGRRASCARAPARCRSRDRAGRPAATGPPLPSSSLANGVLAPNISLRFAYRRWLAYEATYTTDDSVSVAAFIPPGRPEIDVEREAELPVHPPDRLERFRAIGEVIAANTPPEPHWYLNLLGTHPDWQRQGLGTLVIGPIVELCDRERLPLYLETETESNVAYYSHLGFAVRGEWDVPPDGPHMWGMIRAPRSRATRMPR